MDWATFPELELEVAAVDHEAVGIRATSTCLGPVSPRILVPHAAIRGASTGAELFDAVFTESALEAWHASISDVASRGERLNIRMRLPGWDLLDVAWERMYDRGRGIRLGASDRTTLVRVVTSLRTMPPLPLDRPLNVVAMVDEDHVGAASRWTTLEDSLLSPAAGGIVLQRATPVTREGLVQTLRLLRVNVLHLVQVEPDVVGRLPADHSDLRVVVLHGDHRAAAELVSAGVPAVVTLPTSLSGDAARAFLTTFYSGLAKPLPIELVMSRACLVASRDDPGEAAIPALWMSHPRTALFAEPSLPLVVGITLPPPGAHDVTPAAPARRPEPPYPAQTAEPPTPVEAESPPPSTSSVPPQQVHAEPPRPTASARGGSIWRSMREAAAGWLSGSGSRPSPTVRPRPTAPAGPTGGRTAYPRIDVQARRTGRRDVVLVQEPFDVTVGLARYQDPELTQTAGIRFAPARQTDLELVLTFDPSSLVAHDATRMTLTVTDENPYPSARVRFTARYRPDLPAVRRIGVHYLRDGQVVGIAWRRFVVALSADALATAGVPPSEPNPLIDLEPLLGADLPDLVLSICASDGAETGEFVWTAYAASEAVVVPDAPRISKLDNGLQQFVGGMRETVAHADDPYAAYLSLVGKAAKVGRAIPPGIAAVIREVVEDRRRREAATVLLLTEELCLPWELAVLDPPLDSRWGGVSPFLGAHAAIARWPLTQHRPRPTPRSSVAVRRAAVLTADYAGVPGWNRLDHAIVEARQVAALFAPPAVTVSPRLPDVVNVLRGVPAADLLHVALHGQFDAAGSQEGLVLLAADTDGAIRTAQFLTPDQVENGRLDGGPFVFLNACQVASDKRVLGDYGGFASTLLRIGATGVVAPLWNVDDDVAAEFARSFYAATWTATGRDGTLSPTSVAEAVRALRAQYTEAAAEAHTDGVTATLIAFQVFGHPRLRLARV